MVAAGLAEIWWTLKCFSSLSLFDHLKATETMMKTWKMKSETMNLKQSYEAKQA